MTNDFKHHPLIGHPTRWRSHFDNESFGRFSEYIARSMGSARFLVIQSVVVVFWIILNVFAWRLKWDPYPFILLNLVFSTQASYAAPLILLAQTRQAEREKIKTEHEWSTIEDIHDIVQRIDKHHMRQALNRIK